MRAWMVCVAFAVTGASVAEAQCDCDHEIGLDEGTWDGADNGVQPGDRVCVTAGEREFLRLRNLRGSAEAPVTVINCGGRVVIHNEDRAYALVTEDDSSHFRLTGTGDAAHEYGFDISVPDREPYPGVGVWLVGKSSDYEVDHMEIHHTGFAGVSAKTDPLCDGSADQDVFVQRNTHLHHLWIHDTGGEGFYVGSTQSDGHTINCDGSSEVHQPHFLEGVDIHHNLIENTGWDGAQIGMAREGCRFHHNVIRNVGLEGVEYQQQGLQIGTFSACEVYANDIRHGNAMGIIVLGAGDLFVHSNLILDFRSGDGIYGNHRDAVPGAEWRFAFNTIVGYDRAGITVFGAGLGASGATGNLVVGDGAGIGAGGDVDWTESGNVVFSNEDAAGFVGEGDYHLREDSPAIGAAESDPEVPLDMDEWPRANPPAAGAYEYREEGADAGPPPARPDAGPRGDASTVPSTDGGGGCSAAGTSPSLASLSLLLLLGRRRAGGRA